MGPEPAVSERELAECLRVLRVLVTRPDLISAPPTLLQQVREQAAGLLRSARAEEKRASRQRDRELLDTTGIRRGGTVAVQSTAVPPTLKQAKACYICKQPYTEVHFFYDGLCVNCGDFNHAQRQQTADLSGRIALVTGGRIKIGQAIVLRLLRAGATVLATTRFPHDAARRFAAEPDFAEWSSRLMLHALDLRCLPVVEDFCAQLREQLPHLDILINNAAQTIRRPPAFFQHLLEGEQAGPLGLPAPARAILAPQSLVATTTGSLPPALLTQLVLLPGDEQGSAEQFPPGELDADRQQVDRRPVNSWILKPEDVALVELLEVHAVNSLAPFLLFSRLEALLRASPHPARYVVNVSAVEGQFGVAWKTGYHVHTNMAKAGMNMLTRTCAERCAKDGIYINSVDTGWVTNEFPAEISARMATEGFRNPLDVSDGAARVLAPVFSGVNSGQNSGGNFLKDYRPAAW